MNTKELEGLLFALECKLDNIRIYVRSNSKAEFFIDEFAKFIRDTYKQVKEVK